MLWGAIRRGYVLCALTLFNTIMLFVVLNVSLFAAFKLKDYLKSNQERSQGAQKAKNAWFNPDGSPVDNGKRTSLALDWFDYAAYRDIDSTYAAQVLDDFYGLAKQGFIYQPWVQFSEPPYAGKLLNIELDPRGIPSRRTINPPNDRNLPVVAIFALGGSTTLGYNVSDEHTWPSYLSSILNQRARDEGFPFHVQVSNYGRGFFNPSQETLLLTDLLKIGHRPSLVLFMDGVNLTRSPDVPRFTNQLSRAMQNLQTPGEASLLKKAEWLPIMRLSNALQERWLETNPPARGPSAKPVSLPMSVDYLVNSFEQNRKLSAAIASVYEAKTLFFLQPSPVFNYPLELYRRTVPETFTRDRRQSTELYGRLKHRSERIYLGDLFALWGSRKAIIDDVHYSPAFNEFLAKHVADRIALKALVPARPVIEPSQATGGARS